jgi:hypothetical protein
VELGLEPVRPVELYYGTARDLAQSILRDDLDGINILNNNSE